MAAGVSVGLNSHGRVVIGVTAECGRCEIRQALNDAQAEEFLHLLTVQIKASRRVQQLQLPWIHDEGRA